MDSSESQARKVAESIGVSYAGPQLSQGRLDFHLFKDPRTGSSFGVKNLDQASAALERLREKYLPETSQDFGGYPYHAPRVITPTEYEKVWKPAGWNLLQIGPTATWRKDWGAWEAIRDIVQNALDEAETYSYGYDDEGLWIADQGKGIGVEDFLLGPPKLKSDYARGKYGEGMKIACLALIREGYAIHVETAGRELWVVFLEQEVNGRIQTLAALWKKGGADRRGTVFHIIGYKGTAFPERFAVNLPRDVILAAGPSTVFQPRPRYNQLIGMLEGGSRIYARDIYMRDLNSIFSYNLWGFAMAPDRHAPAKEDDVWLDMGRLWATVTDVEQLKLFLQMVKSPPEIDTEEGRNISMELWRMNSNEVNYESLMAQSKDRWLEAWNAVMGEDAIIRTNEKYDNIVRHLGYKPVSLSWGTRDALTKLIPDDLSITHLSQERLRETEIVPDEKLDSRQMAHLKLAREIARRAFFTSPRGIYAAIIPPASDRVRTAGMYGTTTRSVYIALDQLYSGRNTIDVLIHELAHHKQFMGTNEAEDLTPSHAAAMTEIAARVVASLAQREFDEYLKDITW